MRFQMSTKVAGECELLVAEVATVRLITCEQEKPSVTFDDIYYTFCILAVLLACVASVGCQ